MLKYKSERVRLIKRVRERTEKKKRVQRGHSSHDIKRGCRRRRRRSTDFKDFVCCALCAPYRLRSLSLSLTRITALLRLNVHQQTPQLHADF